MNQDGGNTQPDGARAATGESMAFTPMAYDGITWLRIDEPQRDARAACMTVAAYVHLLQPGAPLAELEASAEKAVSALEAGASSAPVIDKLHRLDRTEGPGAAG